MTNFDLHEQAQQLADTRSAYSLARELLELHAKLEVTGKRLESMRQVADDASDECSDMLGSSEAQMEVLERYERRMIETMNL